MSSPATQRSRNPPGQSRRHGLAGFTLIELVMVVVLVGVLAVFIAPKFTASDVNARGFHDETLALLRYAQKTAVAQRRTVCVSFSAGGLSLRIASAASATTCDLNLTGPRGDSPAAVAARSGVAYSSAPTSFNFDALGQPVDSLGAAAATQTLQVAGVAYTITVESGTGYVHE